MTARTLIKCNGPLCKLELDSRIHASTWFILKEGDIFTHDPRVEKPDKHFCSYRCLHNHVILFVSCIDALI